MGRYLENSSEICIGKLIYCFELGEEEIHSLVRSVGATFDFATLPTELKSIFELNKTFFDLSLVRGEISKAISCNTDCENIEHIKLFLDYAIISCFSFIDDEKEKSELQTLIDREILLLSLKRISPDHHPIHNYDDIPENIYIKYINESSLLIHPDDFCDTHLNSLSHFVKTGSIHEKIKEKLILIFEMAIRDISTTNKSSAVKYIYNDLRKELKREVKELSFLEFENILSDDGADKFCDDRYEPGNVPCSIYVEYLDAAELEAGKDRLRLLAYLYAAHGLSNPEISDRFGKYDNNNVRPFFQLGSDIARKRELSPLADYYPEHRKKCIKWEPY